VSDVLSSRAESRDEQQQRPLDLTSPSERPGEVALSSYYATLPPDQRPAPFREGNIIWINHAKDLDDYEKHMKMSDTVRYYPDMDPALKYDSRQ
jgi:hypothetical protein